jgi:hypothetical protein
MRLTLEINEGILRRYAREARRIRRALASEVPTTEQMIVFELTAREPREVGRDYLEIRGGTRRSGTREA